jgi:hypothetical protein
MKFTSRQAIKPHLDQMASFMRMSHWKFVIDDDSPEEEEVFAQIKPWFGQFSATLRFADRFLEAETSDQAYTLIHELLHAQMAHADELVREELSKDRHDAWSLATEYAIDQLARTLVDYAPKMEAT